ncbi:MAG: PAS domain S-box protein [Proteobacteria bacterium]|nr:PAS domain S-box protein [Pseudomonadota bacterium]
MKGLLTLIERFKLNSKLMLGFSSGLVIAAAIGFYSLSTLASLETEMERIYEADLLGISHIKEANINLIYMGRALRQMMIAQDDASRDMARAQLLAARESLRSELAEGRKRIFRAEAIARHDQFTRNFRKHNEMVEHALALIEREKANPSAAAHFITSPEYVAAVNAADDDLTALTKIKEAGTKVTIEAARQRAEDARRTALLLMAIGIGLAIGFGVLIGASIKRPNERLRNSVEELAAGKIDTPIPHTDYPNEIGVLARAIGVLQEIYRKADAQHWVKSHVAEISAALHQAEDLLTLTQAAVSRIAPVVNAGHGAFYVTDAEGRHNLLASYAHRERKHLNNSFAAGESLVGQCAMEKTAIVLTAPKDYIRIGSGLGEGQPACIIVLPVIHAERVLGVLEFASFQQFSERDRGVLEDLLPVLAASMEILDRSARTKELLVATKEQAERMEKQAAQLEEQQVEMEAQQAELSEAENWFRSIIETAPDGMLVADDGGRILLTNPAAETLFGYAPGELIGGQIEQLVPERVRGKHGELRADFIAEGLSRAMGAGPRVLGLRKDGGEFAIAVSLSPLPERGGRGKCISISVRAAGASA